jgi:hypothetical protein
MNLKDEIWQSFENEFWKLDARDVQEIEIFGMLARISFKTGVSYTCKITKKGVRKHSWRLDK